MLLRVSRWMAVGEADFTFADRIQKFSNDGTFITAWGTYGKGDGQFYAPLGLAIHMSGNVFVADYGDARIQEFTNDGAFLAKLGNVL